MDHAPPGATVLVQDYHLTLVARRARLERDDLRFVHFHHTPFAGPDGFRVLPPRVRTEMLEGLASHDACGFHTAGLGVELPGVPAAVTGRRGSDLLRHAQQRHRRPAPVAASPECAEGPGRHSERTVGGRRVVARVDRMELSKNIVRGFAAFDRLLEQRPDLHDRVVFVACCYPSRLGVEDYARYRDEVVAAAASVNERWGTDDWQPVALMTDDDFPRSVAVLRRYDVLLVNPIRDGLNLVAKEGPLLNEHDGQVLLSTEAGAYAELADAVDPVFPFDIEGTAQAMAAALDRDPEHAAIPGRRAGRAGHPAHARRLARGPAPRRLSSPGRLAAAGGVSPGRWRQPGAVVVVVSLEVSPEVSSASAPASVPPSARTRDHGLGVGTDHHHDRRVLRLVVGHRLRRERLHLRLGQGEERGDRRRVRLEALREVHHRRRRRWTGRRWPWSWCTPGWRGSRWWSRRARRCRRRWRPRRSDRPAAR